MDDPLGQGLVSIHDLGVVGPGSQKYPFYLPAHEFVEHLELWIYFSLQEHHERGLYGL